MPKVKNTIGVKYQLLDVFTDNDLQMAFAKKKSAIMKI